MTRRRVLVGLFACGCLLLAQLHVWGAQGCSMCGASCRCASHLSGDSRSVRSVGCGGGGAVLGSDGPLRAVLSVSSPMVPPFEIDGVRAEAACVPRPPARPPLDRPPRVSR